MKVQKYGSKARLLPNQLYTVRFSLKAETKEFSFTSRYSPLYSTVKIIRNDFPDLLEGVPDDRINFSIWQASLLANELANTDNITDTTFTYAVKQYVRYKTEYDLVRNLVMSLGMKAGVTDKTLGELRISKEVQTPELEEMLTKLNTEIRKWESAMSDAIQSRGAIRSGTDYPYPLNARVSF